MTGLDVAEAASTAVIWILLCGLATGLSWAILILAGSPGGDTAFRAAPFAGGVIGTAATLLIRRWIVRSVGE